jgi:hypothetical protein
VFGSEDHPNVISIRHAFELLSNTLHMWNTHRAQRLCLFIWTATLGNNAQVNETLWITIELKVTSQAANFFKQILLFMAYGGSSVVKTLNKTSFHMQRMVRFEVEISASVGGFPVDLGGQCHLFPDDQNIGSLARLRLVFSTPSPLAGKLESFIKNLGQFIQLFK